jgi:endonuclease YncB( thermonuclease family)
MMSILVKVVLPSVLATAGLTGYYFTSKRTKIVNDPLNRVEFAGAYDGDTFSVNIPSLPDVFGKQIPVRIAHIDAPEKNGDTPCEKRVAAEAGEALEIILANAKRIDLINPQRDKYFRILSDVLVDKKVLVSEYMLKNKLAYPYEGDTKPLVDWCKYGKQ